MLDILVLLFLAYLGFGVFLTVSPLIRDSVSLKLHPEKIDDKRVLLIRRVVSHLAIRAGSGNLNSWDKWIFCLTAA